MDLLTHILSSARTRCPLIADLRLADDVSLGFPHLSGVPFHYVVEGSCHLALQTRRVDLETGDFVMLPFWPGYRVETGTGQEQAEIVDLGERQGVLVDRLNAGLERPLSAHIGSTRQAVRLLSGIIALNGPGAEALRRDLPEVTLIRHSSGEIEPWLTAALDFISAEARAPEPGFGAVAERLIELVFVATLRRFLLQSAREKGRLQNITDLAVARALDALHAEPGRHWTLRDMAAASGQSRSGFAEHFRTVMEETPFSYLARLRMQQAAIMVQQGNRSTADIATRLGYRNAYSFSRMFRDVFGETPTQYRLHRRQDVVPDNALQAGTGRMQDGAQAL